MSAHSSETSIDKPVDWAAIGWRVNQLVRRPGAMQRFRESIISWKRTRDQQIADRKAWLKRQMDHFKYTIPSDSRLQDESADPPGQGWKFIKGHIWRDFGRPPGATEQAAETNHAPANCQSTYLATESGWCPPDLLPEAEPRVHWPLSFCRCSGLSNEENRPLSIEEKYVVCSALHDVYCPGVERIDPWREHHENDLEGYLPAMAYSNVREAVSDLSASAVRGAIGDLRTNGKSLKTCNHYLRAVKQFARWLKADGRLRDDPIAHLAGFNAATDRRRERRPLDADEQRWLIDTTASAPAWHQLSGVDRAMLYRVACGTGFRASELRSLTPPSFRLEGDSPAVMLRATNSKRRREDLQPIRADLAELLAGWLDGRDADAALWPGRWNEKAAAMIRCDLRRARARWIKSTRDGRERRECHKIAFLETLDTDGRVVDFHALRATYITTLVKGGASVKVAQELARHSDPKLTLNVYTSLGIHDLTGALDALPSVADDRRDAERLRATGTYDGSAADTPADPHQYPHQLERETVRSRAAACVRDSADAQSGDVRKPLPTTAQRETVRSNARENPKATERTRTVDLRFTNKISLKHRSFRHDKGYDRNDRPLLILFRSSTVTTCHCRSLRPDFTSLSASTPQLYSSHAHKIFVYSLHAIRLSRLLHDHTQYAHA